MFKVTEWALSVADERHSSFLMPSAYNGYAKARLGDVEAGLRQTQDALAQLNKTGANPFFFFLLAEACFHCHRYSQAMAICDRGMDHQSPSFYSEFCRIKALCLWMHSDGVDADSSAASDLIEKGWASATRVGLRFLKLRLLIDWLRNVPSHETERSAGGRAELAALLAEIQLGDGCPEVAEVVIARQLLLDAKSRVSQASEASVLTLA
eukprot:TRINITY_DN8121_c0_g1_i1.p1 TRINITY_DN8121_c0_g1~~TRINITY_DN8121_c0_g1_i1.p1  ORF type:complete len:209 (+),score=37.80 TRINITY_DN8121_c0_g1_i1:94-720(+)